MKIDIKNYAVENKLNDQDNSSSDKVTEKRNSIGSLLQSIDENIEKANQNKEKKNEKTTRKIIAKMKAGKKLSSKEMEYLKRFCKELYAEAIKIQRKRNAFEEKIEHCQTKQEVMAAMTFEMGHVIEEGENVEVLMNGFENVLKEFKKTNKFNRLPDRQEKNEENESVLEHYFYREESFDCEA